MKKPAHRGMYLEDALNTLRAMERTFAGLESSDVFEAFTSAEKTRYWDVLSGLQYLIYDLEQDSTREQMAS